MIEASVNTSGLDRTLRDLRKNVDGAGAEAARSGADEFVDWMVRHAPVDTGRYLRGWVQAGNMAGLTQRKLPKLKPSAWLERFSESIDKQIDRIVDDIQWRQRLLYHWYQKTGRPEDDQARKLKREINTDTRRLVKAVEQKRKFLGAKDPVLVFNLFSGGRAVFNAATGRWRRNRLTTVRDKVYGGWGETVTIEGETSVRLSNREPHVRLVERRYRLVSRARAASRRHSQAYSRRVRLQR